VRMPAHNVLIVESGAKARTLQGYLEDGWRVVATGGHVRTLPHDRRAHEDANKAYWANRPGELPAPELVFTDRGAAAVEDILSDTDGDTTFWIATDPDREGEFIAWTVIREIPDDRVAHRVTFHEVTREAVLTALERPGAIDRYLVDSARVRQFLDRLVGYRASSMARGFVQGGRASMGRVQTPTLGFVVERELERDAHVPIPYFEGRARLQGVELAVRFHDRDDPAAWRDEVGKVHPTRTADGEAARQAVEALAAAGTVTITEARESTRTRQAPAPFTTDALLQAAGSRFGWTPRKTSALASLLYETGHITYIRTDSTRLAASAVGQARDAVRASWGEKYLGPGRPATAGTGPIQDAHEAIRPTRLEVAEPDVEDGDARRLYRLVRAQTLASQMAPSERAVVSVEAACEGLSRPVVGSVSWRTFAGWEAAYDEFLGDVTTSPPDTPLRVGAVLALDPASDDGENPRLVEDETRPPPRYRPHTLIRAMKEAGIGRPSTYSRTVEKLQERKYLKLEDDGLAPTPRGRTLWLEVAPLYAREEDEDNFVELFSTEFTAMMEQRLDEIAEGRIPAPETWEEWRDTIRDLHEAARARRNAGTVRPKQLDNLARLLANAPSDILDGVPEDLSGLSYQQANELIANLRDHGVVPAPSQAQLAYIRELVTELGLEPDELEEAIGIRDVALIRTSTQASTAIEELRRLHEERRPPTAAQLRFIADLIKQLALTNEEAAALAGIPSLDELTGGAGGTASALIEALQGRLAAARGDA
jgi:DNA topoisomerase I